MNYTLGAAELSDRIADERRMTNAEYDRFDDTARALAQRDGSLYVMPCHVRQAAAQVQTQREGAGR